MNLLRISWQSLPDLYSRILPEGDPEAQGLRAGWGAIFDWLRTQDLGTQLGIIAGMVAVGYLTYRFFFSSDGGAPGGGGAGGDDDEGGANEPDHQEARPPEIPLMDNRLDNQNIQPVNIALNNPPAAGLGINEAARYAAAAAGGAGLNYMHDRPMNPDRANAQTNPNPNQQQQPQPQAEVEVVVVVEAEGQAVAEQPPVDGQPILHEMNPIIPRVDEQHPEAAEQPNIAPQAEVEGQQPIIHEPGEAIINPQGNAIVPDQQMDPQGAIINAEQPNIAPQAISNQVQAIIDAQGDATEQMEAITQHLQSIINLQTNQMIHTEQVLTRAEQAMMIIKRIIPHDQIIYVRAKSNAMNLLEKFRERLFDQLEYNRLHYAFHDFNFTEQGIMNQFLKEVRLYIGLNNEVRKIGNLSNNARLYCYFISFQISWNVWKDIDFISPRFTEIMAHFETAVNGYPSALPDDVNFFVTNLANFLKLKLQAWESLREVNFSTVSFEAQKEIVAGWFEDFFVDNTFLRIL